MMSTLGERLPGENPDSNMKSGSGGVCVADTGGLRSPAVRVRGRGEVRREVRGRQERGMTVYLGQDPALKGYGGTARLLLSDTAQGYTHHAGREAT